MPWLSETYSLEAKPETPRRTGNISTTRARRRLLLADRFQLKTHPGRTLRASGPSLFTALKEQLGLQLVPEQQTGTVLVIDHAEHPSPN